MTNESNGAGEYGGTTLLPDDAKDVGKEVGSPRRLERMSPRDKAAAERAGTEAADVPTETFSPEGRRASLLARIGDAEGRVEDVDCVLTTGKDIDSTDTSYVTKTVVVQRKKSVVPEHISLFFKMLDKDNNGELDRQEVLDGASKVGMTIGETNKFFDMLDTNGDGVLSFDEFKESKINIEFVNLYLEKATPTDGKAANFEEGERRDARISDAGATKAKLQELQGEGPVEEAERRDARISDAGATKAKLQELQGEGPVEEAERRDARISDAGATKAKLRELQAGEGPVEEVERKNARLTDAGATLAQIQTLQAGEGPIEEAARRDARITDAGATAAQIQALQVPAEADDAPLAAEP